MIMNNNQWIIINYHFRHGIRGFSILRCLCPFLIFSEIHSLSFFVFNSHLWTFRILWIYARGSQSHPGHPILWESNMARIPQFGGEPNHYSIDFRWYFFRVSSRFCPLKPPIVFIIPGGWWLRLSPPCEIGESQVCCDLSDRPSWSVDLGIQYLYTLWLWLT